MNSLPYPRWRSWLSHLIDQRLITAQGQHTEELAVVLRDGKLILQADGAVYSWEDNYYNFREAFHALAWDRLSGDKVLLLGLGLGSIPQILEEGFGKDLDYVAVEHDEVVVELAERYLLYRLSSRMETVVADATAFVAQDSRQYDLILVDLFVDDQVPLHFERETFLRQLENRLTAGGCLISNRLTYTAVNRAATQHYIDKVFLKVFPDGGCLDVESNWMLYSDKAFLEQR